MTYQNIPLIQTLIKHQPEYNAIVPYNLQSPHLLVFDLSGTNTTLQQIDFSNTDAFSQYIFDEMAKAKTPVAIGKYNEDRIIYRQSENFQGIEARSIHLGIDIWAVAGTSVFCPLAGVIHSFKHNPGFGNYGPTLIIEHKLDNITFYTLYGHLSTDSITNYYTNQPVGKGEIIGRLGNERENGNWPPHLHFQIIADIQNWQGDFPGVAAPSERNKYLELCPDPNLILQIKALS